MNKRVTRQTHLDGLRGIAAVVVLLSHICCLYYPAAINGSTAEAHSKAELFIYHSPLNFFYNGELAVSLFFIISGYVLSIAYFDHWDKKKIVSGIVKRYPRLMLLVWISVLLSFAIQEFCGYNTREIIQLTNSSWLKNQFKPPFTFSELLKNIGYGQFLKHNTPTPLNPVLWTIATELKGSLLVFFILLISPKNQFRYLIYIMALIYFFKDYYMLFVAGVILADLSSNRHKSLKLNLTSAIFLITISVVSGSYHPDGRFVLWQLVKPSTDFIKPNFTGAIAIFIVVCFYSPVQRFMNKEQNRFLGRISYSLYIFHLSVLVSLADLLFPFMIVSTKNYHISSFSIVVLSVSFTLALCRYVFTPLDEWGIKKSNRLGNWIYNKVNID